MVLELAMSDTEIPPWENDLCDAITDEIASSVSDGVDAKEIRAPSRGLVGIFDCQPEIRERARLRLVRRLNLDPLNQAALGWLPSDWGSAESLHILRLMLWYACESGSTVPDYWETADYAAETIARMMKCNPAYVMALMQNPELPENAQEEISFTADDLTQQEDATRAAWPLLERLQCVVRNLND